VPLSGNGLFVVWGIVPSHPLGKARLILGLGCRQGRNEQDVNIGRLHLPPVENRDGPIQWLVAGNPGRLEAVIVDDPPLSLSVQVSDKDVGAQALMRNRIVEDYGNSLRINAGALQKHITQGDRVRQAVTERHFTGNSGIGCDHSRISQREGVRLEGRKAQEQKGPENGCSHGMVMAGLGAVQCEVIYIVFIVII
jgi:hypothetical protein